MVGRLGAMEGRLEASVDILILEVVSRAWHYRSLQASTHGMAAAAYATGGGVATAPC